MPVHVATDVCVACQWEIFFHFTLWKSCETHACALMKHNSFFYSFSVGGWGMGDDKLSPNSPTHSNISMKTTMVNKKRLPSGWNNFFFLFRKMNFIKKSSSHPRRLEQTVTLNSSTNYWILIMKSLIWKWIKNSDFK